VGVDVHPHCLLQHWVDLHLPGDTSTRENYKRAQMIHGHFHYARRHGIDSLRGAIVAALRSEKILDVSYLLIGTLLWPETPQMYERVLQGIYAQDLEQRIAATFASVCFIDQDDVACLLSERVVVEEGERLTLQAAREVLEIVASLQHGGTCPRCNRRRTSRIPRVADLDIGLPIQARQPRENTT
jgi:hypothetical protein